MKKQQERILSLLEAVPPERLEAFIEMMKGYEPPTDPSHCSIPIGNPFSWTWGPPGAVQGDVLIRGSQEWGSLAPTTPGKVLKTQGPGVDPTWEDEAGNILSTQGDILIRGAAAIERLAAGPVNQALKTPGPGANPAWGQVAHSELSGVGALDHHTAAILESLLTARGEIIIRGAAAPAALAPGAAGTFLQSQGAGADPVYAAAGGGGYLHTFPRAGGYYSALTLSSASSLSPWANAAGRLYTVPFTVGRTQAFDTIGIRSLNANGTNIRFGIYLSLATGGPGALLIDAGVAVVSNNNLTRAIAETLTAGNLYWLAMVVQNVGSFNAIPASALFAAGGSNSESTAPSAYVYNDTGWVALPDPFPAVTWQSPNQDMPYLCLHRT